MDQRAFSVGKQSLMRVLLLKLDSPSLFVSSGSPFKTCPSSWSRKIAWNCATVNPGFRLLPLAKYDSRLPPVEYGAPGSMNDVTLRRMSLPTGLLATIPKGPIVV